MKSKYFTTNVCKCIHAMYDMHDPNGSSMEQSYDRSSEYKNEVLCQPLVDLSIGCFEVGTSDVRAFDVVPLIDDLAKGQRL